MCCCDMERLVKALCVIPMPKAAVRDGEDWQQQQQQTRQAWRPQRTKVSGSQVAVWCSNWCSKSLQTFDIQAITGNNLQVMRNGS